MQPLRLLALAALVAAAVVSGRASADEPYTMSDPARFTRAAGPSLVPATLIGTTTRWARARPDGPPLCVAWDTLVVLTTSGEMTCVWTMTTTITLGAQDTYMATHLTDAFGPSGTGLADYLPVAGAMDSIPQLATAEAAIGARPGVCTGGVSYGANLRTVYPRCRIDGDCADAGASGTCNTSPSDRQRASSCAFLICRASAADTLLVVKAQR